jgi:hypothetical protein
MNGWHRKQKTSRKTFMPKWNVAGDVQNLVGIN